MTDPAEWLDAYASYLYDLDLINAANAEIDAIRNQEGEA